MTGMASLSPDYRTVLKSIPAAERRGFMKLTNRHGLMRLSLHLGVIAGCAALNGFAAAPIAWLGLVGQGAAMCFLFCAMHEASHGTAFRSKVLNSVVTWGAGLTLGLGPRWFRYFHADHHKFTHDPHRDPELETPKPETLMAYLITLSGIPLWIAVVKTLLRNAFLGPAAAYIPPSGRRSVQREAVLMLSFYLLVMGGGLILAPAVLFQFWILPVVLGQPFLRAFLLAEHAGCPHDPDMLKNSRTIRTHPLVMMLAWNMPYHTAHHSLPGVPFHQLAAFNACLDEHIAHQSAGYQHFHQEFVQQLRG